ncbi:MAG: hypothetical protein GXP30_10725 [Verrucomicrobia bacterium]|nr:hypothetical protein [Verrucomicrobiota bacterium]
MMPLPVAPSALLIGGFVVLAISLVATYALTLKSWGFAAGGSIWLLVTGLLGDSGVLADFSSTPPPILPFLLLVFAGSALLAFSPFGKRIAALPLTFLVGFLAFRVPVEWLIHRAVGEGVAPPQMTWTGMNFDILAGVSALILIPFVKRIPRWGILLWNSCALALLLWIVGVAVLSMPTAIQQIKPDNIWVVWFPFIWLPTVAVTAALIGHLAIFRKLLGN